MDEFQTKSVDHNSIKYTVEINLDQPYYFSSEKIRCFLKISYEKIFKQVEDIQNLTKNDLLDYITIQLYGYVSYSNEIINLIHNNNNNNNNNKTITSLNNFISNILNIGNRIDLINNIKNSNIKSKPIFVSNPYILTSDIKLSKNKGEIGTFFYTCYLPPFLPPTFNGKFISFNYMILITIGINNSNKQDLLYNKFYNNIFFNLPVTQKKLHFNIKCLGSHPKSSKLLFSLFKKSTNYYPITAINNSSTNNSIDHFEQIKIYSNEQILPFIKVIQNKNYQFLESSNHDPKKILQELLILFNKKSSYLQDIINQNESFVTKTRFFELNNNSQIYQSLNNSPKSLFEIMWQYEISNIFFPNKIFENKNIKFNNNKYNDNLTINYKNQLVLNCNIYNINRWSNNYPIIIHFDFSNSYWRTQEINITLKCIEKLNNTENYNVNIIYNYKRCTLWDLEFTHQIQPLSSQLINTIITQDISIYYQLILDFYIFDIKQKYHINYLDIKVLENIIKLSWNSDPILFYLQQQTLNLENIDLIEEKDSINKYFVSMTSILPNNNTYLIKSLKF